MLRQVTLNSEHRVLDLGCGCGIVGICIVKHIGERQVVLPDVDPIAVEVTQANAGFREPDDNDFRKILSKPPYDADFGIAKSFILKGFNRLFLGGEMMHVTKRDSWYRGRITAVFGGHQCQKIDGYIAFERLAGAFSLRPAQPETQFLMRPEF